MDKAVNYRYIALRDMLTECVSHRCCSDCKYMESCGSVLKLMARTRDDVSLMINELKAEKGRPNLWDGAPKEATKACVIFMRGKRDTPCGKHTTYTREPPKSRIDEIAAEAADRQIEKCGMVGGSWARKQLVESYKSAILKDREEREANR